MNSSSMARRFALASRRRRRRSGCHRRHHAGRVLVARSGFESSFQFHSAVIFGAFEPILAEDKVQYLETLTDTFIPDVLPSSVRVHGRNWPPPRRCVCGFRNRRGRSRSGTAGRRIPTKTSPPVCGRAWYPHNDLRGPQRSPDCDESIPVPDSVLGMRESSATVEKSEKSAPAGFEPAAFCSGGQTLYPLSYEGAHNCCADGLRQPSARRVGELTRQPIGWCLVTPADLAALVKTIATRC